MTVGEWSGAAKTNEFVSFGLPLHPDALSSGQVLKIYDDDGGVAGDALDYQWDLEHTDNATTRRAGAVTVVLPSLASGASARKLHVRAETGSLPTGTKIELTDIQALSGYSNGLVKVTATFDGTDYTISVKDIIDGGSTTYSKTGLNIKAHNWRDGPLCREWQFMAAPRNGGSPHLSGDGLHVVFTLRAMKAGLGAVSGGNPITAIGCHVELRNGDCERASGTVADLAYGLLIEYATGISDATMISTDQEDSWYGPTRYSYLTSAPAAGITISQTTFQFDPNSPSVLDQNPTFTRDTGVWAADILGALITADSGGGKAFVVERTSDTVVKARLAQTFGSSTYASGAWKVQGINHYYNAECLIPLWIGNKPTNRVLWGNNDSALAPTTRAAMDYACSTKMLPNFRKQVSEVSHTSSMVFVNRMPAPDGTIRPFTKIGTYKDSAISGGKVGEVQQDVGGASDRVDIAIHSGWSVDGLVKFDSDGRRRVFENARHAALFTLRVPDRLSGSPSAGELGNLPRTDGGKDYNCRAATPTIYRPDISGGNLIGPQETFSFDVAHHSSSNFIPYLMTGDLFWLRQLQRDALFGGWAANLTNYFGTGENRTGVGTASGTPPTGHNSRFGGGQTREHAWTMRDNLLSAAIVPDDDKPSLCLPKAHENTKRWAKVSKALADHGPRDICGHESGAPGGNVVPFITAYPATAAYFPNYGTAVSTEVYWSVDYVTMIAAHAVELGLGNSDLTEFLDYMAPYYEQWDNTTDVVPDIMFGMHANILAGNDIYDWEVTVNVGTFRYPATFATLYKANTLLAPLGKSIPFGVARIPTGTMTISANTVGSGRTITFSNSYFGAGSWYVGGYITATPGVSGGCAKITAVVSATEVTVDIIAVFTSTTPTISTILIPEKAPADYSGQDEAIPRTTSHWGNFADAAEMLAGIGYTGCDGAWEWMTGRTNYNHLNDGSWRRIEPRA